MIKPLRPSRIITTLCGLALIAMLAGGCGTTDPDTDRGRTLFVDRCGACHTLAQAGTTATVGPNLDHTFAAAREVGMTSDSIKGVVIPQVMHPRPSIGNPTVDMPAGIVTGRDLEDVATYVGLWAGVPDAAPPEVDGGPGAQIFADYGCGGCHILAAAGSTGTTGPDLDQVVPGQSPEQVRIDIVDPEESITEGYPAGVMPSNYGETMSDEEIEQLVEYLLEVAGNGGG